MITLKWSKNNMVWKCLFSVLLKLLWLFSRLARIWGLTWKIQPCSLLSVVWFGAYSGMLNVMLKNKLRLLLLWGEVDSSLLHPDCPLFHRFPFSFFGSFQKGYVLTCVWRRVSSRSWEKLGQTNAKIILDRQTSPNLFWFSSLLLKNAGFHVSFTRLCLMTALWWPHSVLLSVWPSLWIHYFLLSFVPAKFPGKFSCWSGLWPMTSLSET